MKYWHELTDKEIKTLIKNKTTYGELAKLHPQPKWCNYPEATSGLMGCWSLTGSLRNKISEDFCKNCELSKDYKAPPRRIK